MASRIWTQGAREQNGGGDSWGSYRVRRLGFGGHDTGDGAAWGMAPTVAVRIELRKTTTVRLDGLTGRR